MAPTRLEAEITHDRGWTVLALHGEVDMASAPRMESELTVLLDDGAARVAVDLHAVSFMDSTGLTALFRAHENAAEKGHEFALVCPAGPVRRVLEVSGVAGIVTVYEKLADLHAA